MTQHIDTETGGVVSVLMAKVLPPALGAAIMVAVDMPETKRELFWRFFVAFAASYLFGDVAFDLLHSFSWFAFLDHAKRAHNTAVDGLVGAVGYFFASGLVMMLKNFRKDPLGTIRDAKKVTE